MLFKVRCNQCGHQFSVETKSFGKVKCKCPYCSSNLLCQLDENIPFRTKARSVIPVGETKEKKISDSVLPVVSTKLLKDAPSTKQLSDNPLEDEDTYKKNLSPSKTLTEQNVDSKLNDEEENNDKISNIKKTISRLDRFQKDYPNGNLWLFFGFSFLFMLLVIAGFMLLAEASIAISNGTSWVFKEYIQLKNSL